MPIPFKLDDVTRRVLVDAESEKQRFDDVASVSLAPLDARDVWPQVLEHKWYMSERLGRDVGLRLAVADYFENIRRVKKRDQLRDTLPPTLPFMRPLGYR